MMSELTDAKRAQLYRELVDELKPYEDAAVWGPLRERADELDPPHPKPGTVVWWRFATYPAELGFVSRGAGGEAVIVDADGRDHDINRVSWSYAPIPDSDGYCVVDGRLHSLTPVPWSHHTSRSSLMVHTSYPVAEIRRKEQEYGL
jgi:hypothetical protein